MEFVVWRVTKKDEKFNHHNRRDASQGHCNISAKQQDINVCPEYEKLFRAVQECEHQKTAVSS